MNWWGSRELYFCRSLSASDIDVRSFAGCSSAVPRSTSRNRNLRSTVRSLNQSVVIPVECDGGKQRRALRDRLEVSGRDEASRGDLRSYECVTSVIFNSYVPAGRLVDERIALEHWHQAFDTWTNRQRTLSNVFQCYDVSSSRERLDLFLKYGTAENGQNSKR